MGDEESASANRIAIAIAIRRSPASRSLHCFACRAPLHCAVRDRLPTYHNSRILCTFSTHTQRALASSGLRLSGCHSRPRPATQLRFVTERRTRNSDPKESAAHSQALFLCGVMTPCSRRGVRTAKQRGWRGDESMQESAAGDSRAQEASAAVKSRYLSPSLF